MCRFSFSLTKKTFYRSAFVACLPLFFAGCGGGSDSDEGASIDAPAPIPQSSDQPSESPAPAPDPSPTPAPDPAPDPAPVPDPVDNEPEQPPISGKSAKGSFTNNFDEQRLDTDQDGLPDDVDNDPNSPLIRLSDDTDMSISSISITLSESKPQERLVVSGEVVNGKVDNIANYSPPYFLLWHSSEGILAQEVTVDETGAFSVEMGEVLPTSVSFTAQGFESDPYIIAAFAANEPIVYAVEQDIFTGEYIEFEGKNLELIEELRLGGEKLSFNFANGKISAQLPDTATSNRLSWNSNDISRQLVLPLKRRITMTADASIENPTEWSALSSQGKLTLTPHGNGALVQAELELPVSDKPANLRFYHPDYRDVEGVIWPTSKNVVLGVKSTIERMLVSRLESAFSPDQIEDLYLIVQESFFANEGVNALASLGELHNQEYNSDNEALLAMEVENMLDWLGANSESFETALARIHRQPPSQGTLGVFDYLDDTFDAIFAGGSMYEQIMSVSDQRAIPGSNDYSGMRVGSYRNASVCVGLENVNRPTGIWPSDLCVKNTGVYFASLEVRSVVDNKVLKSHVTKYLDTNMVGATGWGILSLSPIAYVTSDKGAPLCHMQPCKLEFITGGFGLGLPDNISKVERAVQQIVLGRTLIERLMLPVIDWALGGIASLDQSSTCLINYIVAGAPTAGYSYGSMIIEFNDKMAAANNEDDVIKTLNETVLKYAYDLAAGMLSSGELPKCWPESVKRQMLGNLGNKIGEFADKINKPKQALDIVTNAIRGFEAVITPKKFTFEVAPRASITSITTSNYNGSDIPELFSTSENNKLRIRGTKFVYLQSDNTNYWPKLRLRDRFGNKQTLQLNESHKDEISDQSWVDIEIPIDDLRPLMAKLRGEIINVSIIMDDDDYSDFSSEGLPLPGRDIRWVGQPKVTIARPSIARAGRLITLKGENLQPFTSRADLKLTLIQSSDTSKTGELFKVDSFTKSEVRFRLPKELNTGTYKLRLATSDPNVFLDVPDNVSINGNVGAITVIPNDASTIQLFDAGAKIDDGISAQIQDVDENLITQNGDSLTLELLAGSRLPAVWMWWNKEGLGGGSGNGIPDPGRVLITCQTGGTDQVCTYRVKGEINTSAGFKSINFRGKLSSSIESEDAISRCIVRNSACPD